MFTSQVPTAESPLTEAGVLAFAEKAAELSDWGPDQSFRIGLGILIDAIEDMQPSVEFRTKALARIQHLLIQRLHMIDDQNQHPEILDGEIESPLVITGVPRSGTTVSYDLLALAPDSRTPREWELYCPWPAPEEASFDNDPRIAQLNAMYAHVLAAAPEFATVQRLDASQPGECNHQMMLHFSGSNFPAELSVPIHREWMSTERAEGMYQSHKRVLQQLQWKGPTGRWIIKSPHHLFDMPGLCAVYPGARIVWTHRDPVSTISSLSSMVTMLQTAFGAPVNKHQIGAEITDIWCRGVLRGVQDRDDPSIESRIIDIAHRDVIGSPQTVVERIHQRFEIPFSEEHGRHIDSFLQHSDSAKRLGKHRHSPEEFGIDVEAIRERLTPYYQRFGDLLHY